MLATKILGQEQLRRREGVNLLMMGGSKNSEQAAGARGRNGGRKFELTKAQVRLAQAAMLKRDTSVSELCAELGVTRATLYRYISPKGELREYGRKVLGK